MDKSDDRQGDATASRRGFLGLGAALAAAGPLLVAEAGAADGMKVSMMDVSKDTLTEAGEPILYCSTPNPEITSNIVTIPPGAATDWMVHPVQGFVYVLEGTLTVEFTDGKRLDFKAGQGFPQARTHWHRGRNDGPVAVRFLAVFFGAKGEPIVMNPPKVW